MTTADVDYMQVWRDTTDRLAAEGAAGAILGHLRISRLVGVLDTTAVVQVPNAYTRDAIEVRIREDVTQALSAELGRDVHLAVSIDSALESVEVADSVHDAPTGASAHPDEILPPPGLGLPGTDPRADGGPRGHADHETGLNGHSASGPGGPTPTVAGAHRGDALPRIDGTTRVDARHQVGLDGVEPRRSGGERTVGDTRLNPRYTFDTFVSGSSNRFAHAAAIAVGEAPARAYNPLFIYGGSGLGKTHLLHAVGHYARSMFPNIRVRYVNSEEFTNDFINSVQDGKAASFHARYRSVDVLLIDDIQFLQNKVGTMEEFFHTFNALHNANKQIVITSDVPPKELSGFEERMRTRFEWGLLTDVQPPDVETRIAILRKKAAQDNLSVPDDVLTFIATRVTTNIRELEGALIRVTAYANLVREPVTLEGANEVLKKLLVDDAATVITATAIMEATAEYYGLSIDDICGQSRSRQIATARQIAMYLCRELTELPLTRIGKQFGGRDHATVIHANRKIRELMNERQAIFNQVTELTNRIKQQSR